MGLRRPFLPGAPQRTQHDARKPLPAGAAAPATVLLLICLLGFLSPAQAADGAAPGNAGAAASAAPAADVTALAAAHALIAAFNRHDPAAMAALVTPDFELYYVDDTGQAELSVQGRDALAAEMEGYFAQRPQVRSEVSGAIDGPAFVSFREQIVGGASSIAVYEVREGLVRRAWYYPAEESP